MVIKFGAMASLGPLWMHHCSIVPPACAWVVLGIAV